MQREKRITRWLALLLGICMAFACLAFAGCENRSPEGNGSEQETPLPPDGEQEEQTPTPPVLTKYVQQTEIPTLEITAADPIASKYDYVPATYAMTSESGAYDMAAAEGEIRLRGNYTRTLTKKPYRVKFASKQSPLGMPKAKSWYLLNEATDFSLLRNYLGYTYADELLDYSLRARYVHVKVNGEYRGIYLLTDKRGEDKNRVPVTLTDGVDTGWIVEMDNRAIGGDDPVNTTAYEYCAAEGIVFGQNAFYCNLPRDGGQQAFVISEPDPVTPEQFRAISEHVQTAITSLGGQAFGNYFDVDSMARYFMVEELWHNTDVGSVYLYRENGVDKVKFGPVWDLDLTCGISKITENGAANTYNEWYYGDINALLKPCWRSSAFRAALKKNWNQTYAVQTADLLKGIDETIAFLAPRVQQNFVRWPGIESGMVSSDEDGTHLEVPFFMADSYVRLRTWEKHAAAVKDFLTKRVGWMHTQINAF
ncbi:MAG: hypothetical protein HFE46_07805 [Clostridia bacterium]|nr:hypothetical protein [Clostridia bacterium]